MLFGDVVVTYDKMQEVEFSFFTLPDSGAFITHAPRRLSEAFALVYPFQRNVWPALIITFVIVGPVLYFMISFKIWMNGKVERKKSKATFFDMLYIREMGYDRRRRIYQQPPDPTHGLLNRCVWVRRVNQSIN